MGGAARRCRRLAALRHAFEAGTDKVRLAVALAVERTDAAARLRFGAELEQLQARLADEELAWPDLAEA